MEFLHTMRNISSMVSDTLSKKLVNEFCKSSDIEFEDFVSKSFNLESHFPKFEEIYQMSTLPSLWSDLFSIECKMLCNPLLLNTNVDISKMMCSHVSRSPVDSFYSKRMDLLSHIYQMSNSMYNNSMNNFNHTKKFDHSLDDVDTHTHTHRQSTSSSFNFNHSTTELNENYSHNRNSIDSSLSNSTVSTTRNNSSVLNNNGYLEDSVSVASLFSIISNLSVYNERMGSTCVEDRKYYEKSCKRLFYLSEDDLLNRPEFIKRGRSKILQFLKQFSRAMDIDKCTHNLSILFFDCYLHQITGNQNGNSRSSWNAGVSSVGRSENDNSVNSDYSPFTENELLKIATACYLLAGALREHWVDISKDKYLEHAIDMSYNAFTTKEVISVQLDVLHRMPKGFTSIYTCMEYGLFFLANIKYINHNLTASSSSATNHSSYYFDDFMFLSSSFNFMVQTGALCWIYHCLSKWDDLYIAKNWNRFIPPSRCAAVLVLHFYISFFNIDFEKDVIWCRRFCHRVFKMFFDSDVALWYFVFRENIRSFLICIEKSSERMHKMSSLFNVSSNVFRSIEALVYLYHTKVLLGYFFDDSCGKTYNKDGYDKSLIGNIKNHSNNNLHNHPLKDSNINSDQFVKNNIMDLDSQRDNGFDSNNNLFGIDYEMISSLFSNLIDIIRKS